MKLRLFFSYGRRDEDQEYASLLVSYLSKIPSIELFWDKFIDASEPWKTKLLTKAKEADVFVYLASSHSVAATSFCHQELKAYNSVMGKKAAIFPIILEPCTYLENYNSLTRFQMLPMHPESGKLSPLVDWWGEKNMRLKGCNQIAVAIKDRIDLLISKQEQTQPLEQEESGWGIDLSFEFILSKYLNLFEIDFTVLEPFVLQKTLFPYYFRNEQIAFVPCYYDKVERKFLIDNNITDIYSSLIDKDLPWLKILPVNCWQRNLDDEYTLNVPEEELIKAIINLREKINKNKKISKIHIAPINSVKQLLDF